LAARAVLDAVTQCVFYGGKGGVGKTTCAAATGLALADAGHETLVVSTDPAHSLSDALDADLGGEPREVRSGLEAVEIDPEERADRYQALAESFADDLRAAGIALDDEDVERVFGAGPPPGSDELAALDLLVEYADADRWEYVVFDTAPTGHTLRLLDLPDMMGATLETTRKLRGKVRRLTDSARRVMLGPAYYATGRDESADGFADLQARMERAREILSDPDRTEFRIVVVPETMAIAESERLRERLEAVGVPVSAVVVNRVLEDPDPDCSRCRGRAERHRDRLGEIRERFPGLDVYRLPETEGEVRGVEALSALAADLPGAARSSVH